MCMNLVYFISTTPASYLLVCKCSSKV